MFQSADSALLVFFCIDENRGGQEGNAHGVAGEYSGSEKGLEGSVFYHVHRRRQQPRLNLHETSLTQQTPDILLSVDACSGPAIVDSRRQPGEEGHAIPGQ